MRKLRSINTFRILCVLGIALYGLLFLSLVFSPDSVVKDMGEGSGSLIYFLARRTSTLMLGFAVLLFLVRHAECSKTRAAVSVAVAVNMAGFACTGIFEYAIGRVGTPIFFSVSVELVYAFMFGAQALADYRKLRKSV